MKENNLDTVSFDNVIVNSISIKRDSLKAGLPNIDELVSSLKVKFNISDDAQIVQHKVDKKFVFVKVDSVRVADHPANANVSVGFRSLKISNVKNQTPSNGEKIVMIRAVKVSDTTNSKQQIEYVIKGKVKSAVDLSKIDPNDIQQVHVVKNVNRPQILIETKKSN